MATTALAHKRHRPLAMLPLVSLALSAIALLLAADNLQRLVPADQWLTTIWTFQPQTPNELLFLLSALPRTSVAWLSGAALALAGTIFQQSLRNPLAEPTTLGTSAGAQAALLASLVWMPGLLQFGYGPIAITGAGTATLLVFAIARTSAGSLLSTILAGLVVNLTLGTICAIIVLFYPERSEDLLQWQTGRLEQSSWTPAAQLCLGLLFSSVIIGVIHRPLRLLDVGDDVTLSLGIRPAYLRILSLLVAILLSGAVVATVGMIGFVGLAVPSLARALGGRSLQNRLIWTPVLGGALLLVADQIVQWPAFGNGRLPTGVLAALFGAPVLLILLKRVRTGAPTTTPVARFGARSLMGCKGLAAIALGLIALVIISLFLGRGPAGWQWTSDFDLILRWRAARITAATSAGVLLGIAGMLIQRITANPMASPEVMGVSAGATFGAILLVLSTAAVTSTGLLAASSSGAFLVAAIVVALGWQRQFSSERILLAGIAISTVVGAFAAILISAGGPVRGLLLAWMSGSTYRVTGDQAALVAVMAAFVLAFSVPLHRWLGILPLGGPGAKALGLDVRISRVIVILVCAIATGAATLVVGPASFVGLLAPQMVRQFGFHRALPQLFASALVGGVIMLSADWLGRMLIFPWQIPAGLLTGLIGGPVFLVSMWRRKR